MLMDLKKIYVAEDDPSLIGLLQVILKIHTRYQVKFFTDGLDIYNNTQESPPDLLLLDILLPTLSGLAVTRLLKFEDHYSHIPVIIMSSVTDPDIREQVKYAGADLFLPKPFQPDVLLQLIEQLLLPEHKPA